MSNDKITFAKDLLAQAKEVLDEILTDTEGELDELEEQDNSEDAEKVEEIKSLIDKLEEATSDIGNVINQLP